MSDHRVINVGLHFQRITLVLITLSQEIETGLWTVRLGSLCAWCPEGGLGSYQMGNGLFLGLIKVDPEGEVRKNLRLRKAVLTLSPTNRYLPT